MKYSLRNTWKTKRKQTRLDNGWLATKLYYMKRKQLKLLKPSTHAQNKTHAYQETMAPYKLALMVVRRYVISFSENATNGSLTHLSAKEEVKNASVISRVSLSRCLPTTTTSSKEGRHKQSLQCSGMNPPTVAPREQACFLNLSFKHLPLWRT